MSVLFTSDERGGGRAARVVLPLAGIVACTLAGVAVAAIARRTGVLERDVLELAPDGTSILFDKGGVHVAAEEAADAGSAAAEVAADLAGGRAAACGIRPTFAVEDALDRELAAAEPAAEREAVPV